MTDYRQETINKAVRHLARLAGGALVIVSVLWFILDLLLWLVGRRP